MQEWVIGDNYIFLVRELIYYFVCKVDIRVEINSKKHCNQYTPSSESARERLSYTTYTRNRSSSQHPVTNIKQQQQNPLRLKVTITVFEWNSLRKIEDVPAF